MPQLRVRRHAGQSLNERLRQLVEDRLIAIVFGPMIFWLMTMAVWLQTSFSKAPPLRSWVCASIIVTGSAVISFLRLFPQARSLVRGERGERLVAAELEELRAAGYRCFHDLIQDGFNVDHIVVGPAGVFAVETKFRSGSGLIEFRNGQGIYIAGRAEEGDSLKQARSNAAAVKKLIRQDTGMEVFVKPLVVFVGDWRIKNAWRDTDVRVIAANDVGHYFQRQDQPELTQREIELICSHLKRTVVE